MLAFPWKSLNKKQYAIVFDYPFEWVSSNILEHDIQEIAQIVSLFEYVSVLVLCHVLDNVKTVKNNFSVWEWNSLGIDCFSLSLETGERINMIKGM